MGWQHLKCPMLSLKSVNAISHFTDWTIAHVHIGALGWNGFLTFGILYWLIPKLFNTNLFSKKLAGIHFWLGTLGIVFYAIPLYWAGITQHFMWKEFTEDGVLRYPNFLETVVQVVPMYKLRALGGSLYLLGSLVMVYNLIKTAMAGKMIANEEAEAPALEKNYIAHDDHWHRWIERKPAQMLIGSLIVILIGGMVEIIPTFMVKSNVPTIASVKPYTLLNCRVVISMYEKVVTHATHKWCDRSVMKLSAMVNIPSLVNLYMIIRFNGEAREPVRICIAKEENIQTHGTIITCLIRKQCRPEVLCLLMHL